MDEKVLSVTLSEADEKAMTKKSATRRRRNRKLEGGEEVTQLEKEVAPVSAVPVPTIPVPAVPAVPVPAVLIPSMAVPNVPGVGGAVKIVPKKHSTPQTPTASAPKLVMNKKRTSLPMSSTLKKPKLVVQAQPEPKKKRRFTERKISITMKPFATTRKHQKNMKEKVSAMPLAQVKKVLLQKGLLKPNHKTPEDILRSMLLDYMMLHSED
jgi:hypothetical protein